MYEGAERHAAAPRGRHVEHVDALVALRHRAAPLLQRLRPLQRHLDDAPESRGAATIWGMLQNFKSMH